ncbi:hypothetical protein OsI_36240 [Oryza sativa Indica Group]|uniref:Uncharacterized protein n=1 Tax=Oryza sativa subsp. indica TaxID=39946 RepID=B8BKP8_ORYSI|nr:hypothetical protein OsI_36240 [Oryza sativa Indica Group]
MAGPGVCINLLNGTTMHLSVGKSSSTERTGWVMPTCRCQPCALPLVMRPATGDVSMPPCGCTETTTTKDCEVQVGE